MSPENVNQFPFKSYHKNNQRGVPQGTPRFRLTRRHLFPLFRCIRVNGYFPRPKSLLHRERLVGWAVGCAAGSPSPNS